MHEEKKTPKIKDVARIAGFSTATVSRALSNPDAVAEDTRKVILDAARQTGYRINIAARNLRKQRTGSIVVLVPNLGNIFFSKILAGIEAVMTSNGLSVLVVDTQPGGSRSDVVLDYLHNSRSDGIISLDGNLSDQFLQLYQQNDDNNPPLTFACEWPHSDVYPSVRVDNQKGARLAIEHLANLGHESIGLVNGPENNVLTHERRKGALAEITHRCLKTHPEWTLEGDFSMNSGVQAAQSWLNLKTKPTAMFCASDETAFGFISELHRNGIDVPEEVSVVGFDDIEIASRYIPALTTIRQPRMELGSKAAQMLLHRIESKKSFSQEQSIVLPVQLTQRGSTRLLA